GSASRTSALEVDEPAKSFPPAQVRFYESEVRPILKARCLKCHGDGPKIRGGFRFDSRAAVLRGGDLGPAVSLQSPGESRLLAAIRYEDLEMPPDGKLPAHEIDVLTRWIKSGLPWSDESQPTTGKPAPQSPANRSALAAARAGWSFRPVRRPTIPNIKD